MPAPRKVDLLPADLRRWLEEALRKQGFAGYEQLSEDLNWKLEEQGLELRIQKSALHAFGAEYAEFVKLNDASAAWAKEWMGEMGLADQVQRHNVLFQMLTTLAFKVMQAEIGKEGGEIDPKNLHFLGRMMKDVMSASGMAESMVAKDRQAQAAKLEAAVASGDIDAEAAAKARRIMGFAE